MQGRRRTPLASPGEIVTADTHAAFGSENANLIYALTQRGKLLRIDQKPARDDGPLICPGCQGKVTGVRPEARAYHYRHDRRKGAASGCGGGPETVAHLLAKAVLDQEGWIETPPVEVLENGKTRQIVRSQRFVFDTVEVETWSDGRRPDLSVTRRRQDGQIETVWIEVQVTNPCSEAKIADIKTRGISTLQVVVPDPHQGETAFRKALLSTSEREWLYNKQAADWEKDRAARLEERARQVISATRRPCDTPPPAEATRAKDALVELGLGAWIGLAVRTAPGFRTSPQLWQAMLIDRLVVGPISAGDAPGALTLKVCLSHLKPCLEPVLHKTFELDMRRTLRAANGGPFQTPVCVLGSYLDQLVDSRLLDKDGPHGTWRVPTAVFTDIQTRLARRSTTRDRLIKLRVRVELLLDSLPAAFDLKAWLDQPVLNGLTPRDYALGDVATWETFLAAVARIERMKRMSIPAETMLGLPLDDLLADTTAKAKRDAECALQEVRRADERAATLEDRAWAMIGRPAAELWLSAPLLRGGTPRLRAREGHAALERMITLLGHHARELNHLAQLEAQAARQPLAVARRALSRLRSFLPPRPPA